MDLEEEKLCAGELLTFTAIGCDLSLICVVDLARGELDQLVFNDTSELTSFRQSSAVPFDETKEPQAGLEQLANQSLLLLEVNHHTEVHVQQS